MTLLDPESLRLGKQSGLFCRSQTILYSPTIRAPEQQVCFWQPLLTFFIRLTKHNLCRSHSRTLPVQQINLSTTLLLIVCKFSCGKYFWDLGWGHAVCSTWLNKFDESQCKQTLLTDEFITQPWWNSRRSCIWKACRWWIFCERTTQILLENCLILYVHPNL